MKTCSGFLLVVVLIIDGFSCIPIFTEEENLKSIVISEIDLPTEQSILTENVNAVDAGKTDTFVELFEKYDELFIKNSTETKSSENEKLKKRSSSNDDENEDELKVETQSILEKSRTIIDPEVRKEFELDLKNRGQITEDQSVKLSDVGTEYDPNYARKIVNIPEQENEIANIFTTERSVGELLVEGTGNMLIEEPTTVQPDQVSIGVEHRNKPEIVEVFEHVFYHPDQIDSVEVATSSVLNLEVEFDPIQVIGEGRDALKNEFTTVGSIIEGDGAFIESEDLEKKNDLEVTKDEVVAKSDGKSELKAEENVSETNDSTSFVRSIGILDTEAPETILEETTSPTFETVTEVVEVHTEISVSIEISKNKTDNATGKPLLVKEPLNSSSSEKSSDKSSEESKSSKSDEEKDKRKVDKNCSESSEENTAKEILDTDVLKIYNLDNKEDRIKLAEELYRESLEHEIKKKDHPESLPQPNLFAERKFTEEAEIADHLDDKIKPTEIKTFEATTVTLYEAFEDVVTTLSDGLKLSNELRSSFDSFREPLDENKTVLDTNNEAISSKNIKNSLVNIAEEMTLENHAETAEASYLMVAFIGVASIAIVVSLFIVLKKKTSRIVFFYSPSEGL